MPQKNWPTCPDCDEWLLSGPCGNPVCPGKQSGNPNGVTMT